MATLPEFVTRLFKAGLKTDTIDEATSATGVTIDGVLVKDGAVTTTGSSVFTALDLNGTLDQDAALTGAGDMSNMTGTINSASASADGLEIAMSQLTTSRSSGTVNGLKVSTTSLAGDSGGTYNGISIGVTDGGGSATHNAILVGAGHDTLIDCSAAATGESDINVGGNLASALEVRTGVNSILVVKTTTNDVAVDSKQRLTTTDGVATGTARVVGGRHSVATAAGSSLTGSSSETVLASASIPASTIKAGTVVKIRGKARVTADNSTTTFTGRLRVGPTTLTGTALVTSAATDTSSGALWFFEFILTGRAAPGASAECVGWGMQAQPAAAGGALVTANLNATNFATNGVLLVEMTGAWSAADANAVQAEEFYVEIIG